jgi:DivIVA domain-containing protein
VDLDRQSIERRDFPIARRGYDPAAVDAHLRALAAEIQELRERPPAGRATESLGSTAASQVQGILEAAETTATDIERSATDDAARMREEAALDAGQTRSEAVQRAQAHVAAVAQATAVLLGRVESMDGEVGALVQSLQAGAGRLAADLGSVEAEMGQLYDAASGQFTAPAAPAPTHAVPAVGTASTAPPRAPQAPAPPARPGEPAPPVAPRPVAPAPAPAVETASAPVVASRPLPPQPPAARAPAPRVADSGQTPSGGDLDGARLVALNMALNGESREQADRYLQENFQLADRAKLLDEVYAAIEV